MARITFDEDETRRLNEAFDAAKEREALTRDELLLESDEADERVRRLVIAQGQLTQARLCYWGMPTQAVIWGYQAIDNAIHAALLGRSKSVGVNHRKKIDSFYSGIPEAANALPEGRLREAYDLWTDVRYERSAVSRDTGQRVVDLAYQTFDFCFSLVAKAMEISVADLDQRLDSASDRVSQPALVSMEEANEIIERRHQAREFELQSMGLSSMAAQTAHGGRDIFLELAGDKAWVRDLMESDPEIANHIAQIHDSFSEIVTALFVHKAQEIIESGANVVGEPKKLIPASDFNVTCVAHYAGLATLDIFRRMVGAPSPTLPEG